MENSLSQIMAAKSDTELLDIIQSKHKYEPEAYIAAIEELERRNLATPELLQEKTAVIESLSKSDEGREQDRGSWKDSLALLRITKEHFYTPLILYINVLVWVLMVLMGVNAFEPSVESLITWGGNLSVLTLNGEPWRLLTSTFLHGGLIHLLLNMFALLQVGALLETQFGKHRYAIIYLATGVLASLASSAFSEGVVSVGASGAIFGLYGLLVSLLITKSLEIEPEARKNLLSSTLTFIGYNVVFGFARAGIDNAAHLGGLFSGFAIGFLYYPFRTDPKKSVIVSIALSAVVLILVWAAPYFIANPYAEYQSRIDAFVTNEDKAMWIFREEAPEPGTPEALRYRERLKTEGIDLWQENINLLNTLNNMPEHLQQRVDLLKEYCQLRIESYELTQLLMDDSSEEHTTRLNEVNLQIEDIINRVEALNK